VPILNAKPSKLSAVAANKCIDLINLISQVKLEDDIYWLWMAIQDATSARNIMCVVFELPNNSSPGQPGPTDKNINVGVDDAWFQYYEEYQAWEYDPLVGACLANPGIHSWDGLWDKIDQTKIPAEKLAKHKQVLIQCSMDDGLVTLVKSESIRDFYILIAIGFPVSEDPESEAILRNVIPHLAGSLERPGVLQAPKLTDKEIAILRLITMGHPYKKIAKTQSITERTVKFHASKIFSALGVSNKSDAIRKASKIYNFA